MQAIREEPIDAPGANDVPVVSAVMPCLNEAATLAICIRKAQVAMSLLGVPGEVIVADNGSTDGSVEIARSLGVRVVQEPVRGYGSALQAGISAARGRIVVMADCDESYDWGDIGRFVDKIREGFDIVMGNRFSGGIDPGAMPPLHRYLGNPVLSVISRIVFRTRIGDFHCGMRAFTRGAYERMKVRTTGMEFATEMIAGAAHAGLRITEIPIRLHRDKRGRPPHLRSFRDGWRHLKYIVTYAPDHLYLAPGSLALALGLMLQGALATGPIQVQSLYVGIHFLVLGVLLAMLGLNLLLMGTLAKMIVIQQYPEYASPFISILLRRFRLEFGIALGALLFIGGLFTDTLILSRWLAPTTQSMEVTVHPAMVATSAMTLGANIVFGSFLLQLLIGGTAKPTNSTQAQVNADEARSGSPPGVSTQELPGVVHRSDAVESPPPG